METSDLDKLVARAQSLSVTSTMLDSEVTKTVARSFTKSEIPAQERANEEEASWQSAEINGKGLEDQLDYLLEHHEYRWLHEMLGELPK
jgi:hypothetical protein